MTFTIGSIASGAGMHLHGLKQIGGVPTWAIEMDAQIAHCYSQNHGGKIHIKKVEEIPPHELEPVDLLIATLSCKNASISKGANRGELSADIDAAKATAAIIKAIKPKYFILENVWLYRQFEGFKLIQSTLEELGYYFKFYKFNLRDWGIAQSRDRLYALASRDGSFPDPEVEQGSRGAGGQGWYEVIEDLIDQLPETELTEWQKRKFPELTSPLPLRPSAPLLLKRVGGGRDSDRLYKQNEPSFTIRAVGRKSDHHSRIADAVVGDKIVAITPRACLRFFGDKETADSIWLPPTKSLACEVVGNGASWVMFKELFRCLAGARETGREAGWGDKGERGEVAIQSRLSPHPSPSPTLPTSRHHLDFYESPWWFTTELLRHVKLEGVIGEPCAGSGAIASLLQAWPHTKQLWTNDIDPNKQADYHSDATLSESWEQFPQADWIITNPPYADQAAPIIKNAYSKARVGVVAFLLTSFLEPCGDRAEFLKQHPPSLVLTFPRYCFRKDKAGKRWATDNITISCFVWDKRSTNQQLIPVPQSEIVGFYKNPDQAISLCEAQEIVKKIAASSPVNISNNLTPHTTMQPQSLNRTNAKPKTQIIDQHRGLGTIEDDLGFGFTVSWVDGEELIYNWERDSEVIKAFEIAPQSTNEDTMTFEFPQAEAIAAQIGQLQAQLAKYEECKANANLLKEQVAAQAQLMLELEVNQQTITDWANRIYFLATGTDVAAMAIKSVELAAKLTLLEQENKALKYQLDNATTEVEEVKQERDRLLSLSAQSDAATVEVLQKENKTLVTKCDRLLSENKKLEHRIYELERKYEPRLVSGLVLSAAEVAEPQIDPWEGYEKGDKVTTDQGEGEIVGFVYGNAVVDVDGSEYQFRPDQVTKPQKSPESLAQDFMDSIKEKPSRVDMTDWADIAEVCGGNKEVLKELYLHARTKAQKKLIDKIPALLATYIEERGDRSDLEWIDDDLRTKVEELLVPKQEVA